MKDIKNKIMSSAFIASSVLEAVERFTDGEDPLEVIGSSIERGRIRVREMKKAARGARSKIRKVESDE